MSRTCIPLALLAFAFPRLVSAACADPAAVAATRAQAELVCPCATATTHGAYVRCVADVARVAADHGDLPNGCRGAVVRCAAKSTCGRPGFFTCCRTKASGQTSCSRKSDASRCRAPSGGHACVGSAASCCDACTAGGCTNPTTSTTTTTTVPAPVCGNGTIEPPEFCDGATLGICQSVGVPHCGEPGGPWPCQCCLEPGEGLLEAPGGVPCCDGGVCQLTGPPSTCVCGCIPPGLLCQFQQLPCCAGSCSARGICE